MIEGRSEPLPWISAHAVPEPVPRRLPTDRDSSGFTTLRNGLSWTCLTVLVPEVSVISTFSRCTSSACTWDRSAGPCTRYRLDTSTSSSRWFSRMASSLMAFCRLSAVSGRLDTDLKKPWFQAPFFTSRSATAEFCVLIAPWARSRGKSAMSEKRRSRNSSQVTFATLPYLPRPCSRSVVCLVPPRYSSPSWTRSNSSAPHRSTRRRRLKSGTVVSNTTSSNSFGVSL